MSEPTISIGGKGVVGDLIAGEWSVEEATNSVDILNNDGSTGGVTATFESIPQNVANNPFSTPAASSEYVFGQASVFNYPTIGSVEGNVINVSKNNSVIDVDCSTPLSVLNSTISMPPYVEGALFYSFDRMLPSGVVATNTNDICVNADGNIWACGDNGSYDAVLYDRFGNILNSFSTVVNPLGIEVDSAGYVYILGASNVIKYDPVTGSVVDILISAAGGVTFFKFTIDIFDNIFIATNTSGSDAAIRKYNNSGVFQTSVYTYDPAISYTGMGRDFDGNVAIAFRGTDFNGRTISYYYKYDNPLINGVQYQIAGFYTETSDYCGIDSSVAGEFITFTTNGVSSTIRNGVTDATTQSFLNQGITLSRTQTGSLAVDPDGGGMWVSASNKIFRLAGGSMGTMQAIECYLGAGGYRGTVTYGSNTDYQQPYSKPVVLRTNLFIDPFATVLGAHALSVNGGSGVLSTVTGGAGPIAGVTTFVRGTVNTAGSSVTITAGLSTTLGGSTLAAVTAGSVYTASGHIRSGKTGITAVHAAISWYNSSNVLITTDFNPNLSAPALNTWTRYSVSRVAPAGAAYAALLLQVDASWVSTNTIDFSCTQIEQSATMTDFFSGNTASHGYERYGGVYSYSWSGTSGYSTSLETFTAVPVQVNFPSWNGDVWSKLKELCSRSYVTLTSDGSGVLINRSDNRQDVLRVDISNLDQSPKVDITQPSAQIIKTTSQNVKYSPTGWDTLHVSDLGDNFISVDYGEHNIVSLDLGIYAANLDQPQAMDPYVLPDGTVTIGPPFYYPVFGSCYSVIDSSQPPLYVPANTWNLSGGKVQYNIDNDKPGAVDVIVDGPGVMAGFTGPFKIARLSGFTPIPFLQISGYGMSVSPETFDVYTGADIDITYDINSVNLDSIFLDNMSIALDMARFSAARAAGGELNISFSIPSSNVSGLYGHVSGSYFFWNRNMWRIVNVSYSKGWAEVEAVIDTRISEVEDGSVTRGDFDSLWSGFRYHDFYLSPGILGQ